MNENSLRYLATFSEHLPKMQLSRTAEETLRQTSLVLLVGPTSSGRNTIIHKLMETGAYHNLISDTTRHRRTRDGIVIEENGREYWFRDEEAVLADVMQGEFLEAAIIHGQQVSGISIREIEKAHEARQIAITDVEPNGAATVYARKRDTKLIFVVPPVFDQWMDRLRGRHDMPETEVRRRLETACQEIEAAFASTHYTFVQNDILDKAVEEIDAIVKRGEVHKERETAARARARELQHATAMYLALPMKR